MGRPGRGSAIFLALLAAGCGGTDPEELRCVSGETMACVLPDGTSGERRCGPDFRWLTCATASDGGTDEIAASPAPPTLTPCPAGWREVADERTATSCDPYPEGGPASCLAGEAHFPGGAGCAPVGAPCPAGTFADDLPADAPVVYALAGAAGGDGSAARPHGSLGAALAAAAAGATVAVGRGTYAEPVELPVEVTLHGACAEATVLSATLRPTADLDAVVRVRAAGAGLRGVTVGPSERRGVVVDGGGSLDLHGVVIMEVTRSGLLALGATTEVSVGRVAIRRVAVPGTAFTNGGLVVGDGAHLAGVDVVVEEVEALSVKARGPATELRLGSASIRNTQPDSVIFNEGRGVSVEDGALIELAESILDGNRSVALSMSLGAPGRAALEDSVVRDTQPEVESQDLGAGAYVQSSEVTLRRTAFWRNHKVAIIVVGPDAALTLEDVLVADTLPVDALFDPRRGGHGIDAVGGVEVAAARVAVVGNLEGGLLVSGAGTHAQFTDITVADTSSEHPEGLYGRAFQSFAGAQVTLERARLSRNREVSFFAAQPGTVVTAVDLRIEDSMERVCGATDCVDEAGGHALESFQSAVVGVRRFQIERSALCGVLLAEDAQLDLVDGAISNNAIGACVQVPGYDISRLTDGVAYADNGTSLDSTELPVPDVPPSILR